MFELVIADAVVHLPASTVVEGWLAVQDGRVVSVGEAALPPTRSIHDAHGQHLIPGVIDTHVHFRDPGETAKEDFQSGTLAAAFGGVTTVVDMPNTGHMVVTPADVREKRDHVEGRSWVDFGLHAMLTDSSPYVAELADLGVASLKWLRGYDEWNGLPCQPSSHAEMCAVFAEAAARDMLVQVHAEALPWLRDLRESLRAEGRTDRRVHGESRPPFVEAIAVAEAAIVAAEFGCRLHVVHVTGDVPLRTGSAMRGALMARLTMETCPQYLFLSQADVDAHGTNLHMNPPLRTSRDQAALWDAVRDGSIYSIASDHAPHRPDDKLADNPLDAASGVIGVETMLPLLLDASARGLIAFDRVIELLCEHPAELVRLHKRKGALLPGFDADMVLLDLEGETVVRSGALHGKQAFTPYDGRRLQGALAAVFVRGRPLIAGGHLVADAPFGAYVASDYAASLSGQRNVPGVFA